MEAIVRRADGKHVLVVGIPVATLEALKLRPLEESHDLDCRRYKKAPPVEQILVTAIPSEEAFVAWLTAMFGPEARPLTIWRGPG